MNIFASWQVYACFAAYVAFMAAVGALEQPDASSSKGYRWLYRFLNSLAVNVKNVADARFPSLPTETK
jgi:hypothetical protein